MFLWDRYRALRKDMNQQSLAAQGRAQLAWSITAVEEVVRFLLLVDSVLMGEDKVRPRGWRARVEGGALHRMRVARD